MRCRCRIFGQRSVASQLLTQKATKSPDEFGIVFYCNHYNHSFLPLHTCSAPIHRVTTFSLSHPFPADTRKIALHICSGHSSAFHQTLCNRGCEGLGWPVSRVVHENLHSINVLTYIKIFCNNIYIIHLCIYKQLLL